jgi:hypothetical protein
MTIIVTDATMLWCRWALRRLGHLLAGYPNLLRAELKTPVGRDRLQKHFDDVRLPHQPPDIQHAIAWRSAGRSLRALEMPSLSE